MNARLRSSHWPLSLTWLLLLGLSTGAFVLAEAEGSSLGVRQVVLAVVFVKLVLIAALFMELAYGRRRWLLLGVGLFALTSGLLVMLG